VAIVCHLEYSGGLIGLNFAFHRAQVKKLASVEGPALENHRLGFILSFYLPFFTRNRFQLLLALFRIIEPTEGTIYIDSIDITKIGLHDCQLSSPSSIVSVLNIMHLVRSAISIVPQSPDLFEGTIRDNIDPLGVYSDVDIWVALEQVHCIFGRSMSFSCVFSRFI